MVSFQLTKDYRYPSSYCFLVIKNSIFTEIKGFFFSMLRVPIIITCSNYLTKIISVPSCFHDCKVAPGIFLKSHNKIIKDLVYNIHLCHCQWKYAVMNLPCKLTTATFLSSLSITTSFWSDMLRSLAGISRGWQWKQNSPKKDNYRTGFTELRSLDQGKSIIIIILLYTLDQGLARWAVTLKPLPLSPNAHMHCNTCTHIT